MTPVRIVALGDCAWTVVVGHAIDPAIHARVLGLAEAVHAARTTGEAPWQGVRDVVPSFAALTVHYDPLACDGEALKEALCSLAHTVPPAATRGRTWRLPACFAPPFAPDLPAVAERAGLSSAEVVERLTGAKLRVYQIGFLPGFPYMGGLPALLHLPRLATPRTRVPAGSIALAGGLCGVYPCESPGGWHLVGRTPLLLFDLRRDPPALLASGDTVQWYPIDAATFAELHKAAQAGHFDPCEWLGREGAA